MKVPINIKDLAIFPMITEETAAIAATYGENKSFKNRFMSFNDTPKSQSGSLLGDGAITNQYSAKNGGDLTLNIQQLVAGERVALFDESEETDGTTSMGKDDLVPYCAVVFKVENDDGTIDLYKYPKVKFTEQQTGVEQKSENGVKYSTTSLKGTYIFDLKNKKARHIKEDMDEVTDAAEIAAWYESGAFEVYTAE